jgi:hypothetical protein
MLLVKETEDRQLIILNALGEVVAQHHKLPGRHKRVIVAAHYAGLPVLVRPAQAPQAIQSVIDSPTLVPGGTMPQVEARPLSVYAQLSEVYHD